MATLYKNRNIWYLTVSNGNNRLTRSLRTKDKLVAKKLMHSVELELLLQLSGTKRQSKNLPFDDLVKCYLKADHNWSKRTRELNEYVFRSYQSCKRLPLNPTSRSIFVRTINACWNWGLKQSLITKAYKLEGDTKGESRNRVLSDSELKTLLDNLRDKRFNLFVRFAYYTGARRGEINSISRENIFSNHIVAYGKSGKRLIKLNNQAQEIISNLDELWGLQQGLRIAQVQERSQKAWYP